MRKSHIIQTKKRPSEQGGRSGFYSVTLQNSGDTQVRACPTMGRASFLGKRWPTHRPSLCCAGGPRGMPHSAGKVARNFCFAVSRARRRCPDKPFWLYWLAAKLVSGPRDPRIGRSWGEIGAGGGLPTPPSKLSYSKIEISSHFRPEEVAAGAMRALPIGINQRSLPFGHGPEHPVDRSGLEPAAHVAQAFRDVDLLGAMARAGTAPHAVARKAR